MYETIVSAGVLASHLGDPSWRIIDCRFDLANPALGFRQYQQSHIPGAAYAHLDQDLSGPRTPLSGRHPLPQPDAFRRTCARLGISNENQVVVYDSAGGAYAARLWWLLQDYGHLASAVLDGGWQAWLKARLPVAAGEEIPIMGSFQGLPGHMPVISTLDLEREISLTGVFLLDARSPERFGGYQELVDPTPGHIPGAANRFHGNNLDASGHFLPAVELRNAFSELVGRGDPSQTVVYCGSGVTSCHHVLAMKIAGLPLPRLYVGSWSEWIRDPRRPIASRH